MDVVFQIGRMNMRRKGVSKESDRPIDLDCGQHVTGMIYSEVISTGDVLGKMGANAQGVVSSF